MAKKTERVYNVTIVESSRKLTAREKLKFTDVSPMVHLDSVCADDGTRFILSAPAAWAQVNVENNAAENPNYTVYVVQSKDGTLYMTSSESFWTAFRQVFDTMAGEEEEYDIEVFKTPSKNYKGKCFLSCSIL